MRVESPGPGFRVKVLAVAALAFLVVPGRAQPLVDYHQHLFSPAVIKLSPNIQPIGASDLIGLLDAAEIRRALVLSVAYMFGNPNKPAIEDEYAHVKAENDWTSSEVAKFPNRLRGFCGVNPLKDYALQEIERCAKDPYLHFGLKLHFGNSDVDLKNPQHLRQLERVFRTANEHRMAIVIHMRPSVTRKRPYGAEYARVFLEQVVPAAPDVAIQIAHLAGAGDYDDPAVDEAIGVFADAIASKDPHTSKLYFDVSGVVGYGEWAGKVDLIARRIRELGVDRILFGSDGYGGGNLAPRDAWAIFRKLPLSKVEFKTIENNLTPYLK
jgi:predicted TIM-barrel fold metal-dependent hydrolase